MIFFEDAISSDEPVTQHVIYFLGGPPSMVFPVWKPGEKGNILNKVDGGVSKQPKCGWVRGKKLTICQPPHPHVHGHNIPNLFQFGDAQQGCTTVWTPSTWCLNTKHVMGWDENANPLSGQSKCLENQLFILFQHFAGYTMVILCWRSTGRINKHFTMVYHLWRPQSQCFENPLKTNVGLLFGGCSFPLTVSSYSSDHLPTTPRCNGSFGHSAEPQRPRCFFMAPTRLWCLGQGTWGMHQV